MKGAKPDQQDKQLPVERGLFASEASWGAVAQSGPGSDAASDDGEIGGGHGSTAAWSRPDLVLAAPGGIGSFTPASQVSSAGGSTSMVAGQDVQHLAQGHMSRIAKDGLVLFTYGKANNPTKPNTETGIRLHAATGSVNAQSQTGPTHLTADSHIDVASTTAQVSVASPKQILLTAGGAAIRIETGKITLSGPGKVEYRAGMKELTGGSTAQSPSYSPLVAGSLALPDQFSARFDLYDVFVQHQFQEVKYIAKLSDGKFLTGTLDPHGRSRQIYASDQKNMEILAGPDKPAWGLIFDYEDAGI